MKNYLHHLEYEESCLDVENIKKIILEKKIIYDHSVDKRGNKWNSPMRLKREENLNLPKYIIQNRLKFKNWMD
jgi:hypothetical protein